MLKLKLRSEPFEVAPRNIEAKSWLIKFFKDLFSSKKVSFCHRLSFIIPIFLQPGGLNHWYFKLRLLYLTELQWALVCKDIGIEKRLRSFAQTLKVGCWFEFGFLNLVGFLSDIRPGRLEHLVGYISGLSIIN